MEVLDRAIAWHESRPPDDAATTLNRSDYGRLLFLAGRVEEAREIYDDVVNELPDNLGARAHRAFLAATLGDTAQALSDAAWLEDLDLPFDEGRRSNQLSAIAAALGDRENAVNLLRRAVGQGYRHNRNSWVHEYWTSLRGYPPYEDLIRPKG